MSTSSSGTRDIFLPRTFWHDHADRELPAGILLLDGRTKVQVRVTPAELAEIRNDAAHYASDEGPCHRPDPEDAAWYRSLRKSAKATVRAIDRLLSGVGERRRTV